MRVLVSAHSSDMAFFFPPLGRVQIGPQQLVASQSLRQNYDDVDVVIRGAVEASEEIDSTMRWTLP